MRVALSEVVGKTIEPSIPFFGTTMLPRFILPLSDRSGFFGIAPRASLYSATRSEEATKARLCLVHGKGFRHRNKLHNLNLLLR